MSAPDEEDVVERAGRRVGTVLRGKYHLERVLGVGGMATVYAATHRNGKEFAVKVLHPELALKKDIRSRFVREGYVANAVKHPGAVAVLDDDVGEDGTTFLVMELMHGHTVEALWQRSNERLPVPLVAGIALQLLAVLKAAHARGVVHRDIKPENLMLTADGHLKVLDFGIARLRDAAAAAAHSTQTGFGMGTPAFMAPEHALAKTEEIDAQTDLWSAGASMFTLVSGRLVHEADNAQQVLVLAATKRARPLAKVVPAAPTAFCEVVDKALAFDKSHRWASAQEMAEALEAACTAAFGMVPDPDAVAEMVEEIGEGSTMPRVKAAPAPPVKVELARSIAAPQTPSFAGPTTAVPVETNPSLRAGLPTRPARRKILAVMASSAAAGTAIVVAAFVAFRAGPASPQATSASGTTQATVAEPGASSSRPAARPPEPPPEHVDRPANVPVELLPQAAPIATPGLRLRPAAVPQPAPATPPAGPPPSASPSRRSCDPPYEFDEKGNKIWKRDCL